MDSKLDKISRIMSVFSSEANDELFEILKEEKGLDYSIEKTSKTLSVHVWKEDSKGYIETFIASLDVVVELGASNNLPECVIFDYVPYEGAEEITENKWTAEVKRDDAGILPETELTRIWEELFSVLKVRVSTEKMARYVCEEESKDESIFLVENERGVHAAFIGLEELIRFAHSKEGRTMRDLAVVQFQRNSTAWTDEGRLEEYAK